MNRLNRILLSLLCVLTIESQGAQVFEKRAEAMFDQGKYQQAIDLLSKDAEKLSEKGYLTLAAAYSELKQFDNEIRILNILSTKEPKNYQWYMLIAQAHLKKSRFSKDKDVKKAEETNAVQIFRTTIKANPKFKPAYDQLLEIFLEKKEHHEARELLMEALRVFGDRPQWLNALCELQANDGYLAQAENTCQRAIRRSPAYPNNYVFLSQSLVDQNEMEKAQRVARRAGQKFPESEFAQWGAGKVYLLTKNYEAAIKFFGNAVHADEASLRAHLGLAEALFDSGDRSGALGHYKKACQLGAKESNAIHIRSAETRMKGEEALSQRYRALAETCL